MSFLICYNSLPILIPGHEQQPHFIDENMRLRESEELTQLVNVGTKFQGQILDPPSACLSLWVGQ